MFNNINEQTVALRIEAVRWEDGAVRWWKESFGWRVHEIGYTNLGDLPSTTPYLPLKKQQGSGVRQRSRS